MSEVSRAELRSFCAHVAGYLAVFSLGDYIDGSMEGHIPSWARWECVEANDSAGQVLQNP